MTLAGVRQWRFAPRRRARECVVLLLASSLVATVYPPVAAVGDLSSIVILAVALQATARRAWRLVGVVPRRMLDGRSASS